MTDYTPTTEEIRIGKRKITDGKFYYTERYVTDAEFDRWLAEVKADAWDEGWLHNVDDRIWSSLHDNPYREVD